MSSKKYYNTIAKGYNELYGEEQIKKWTIAKKMLKLSKKDIVLDLGCGTGLIMPELSDAVKEVVGIDNSAGMLEIAPKFGNVLYVLAEAEKMPFSDKYFDKTVSLTVLQDIKGWETVLSEIKRVTKGNVVITILKRNKNIEAVKKRISKWFKIEKIVEGDKDFIFLLKQ